MSPRPPNREPALEKTRDSHENIDRPDYEGQERALWLHNLTQIAHQLAQNDPGLVKQIESFTRKFGFDEDDVRRKIKEDEMFGAHFVKDPKRQNFCENVAAEWIRDVLRAADFDNLPTRGQNAVYLGSNGNFVQARNANAEDRRSKSLDFRWREGNWTIYASHKYTRESGGAQDNQFNDVRNLISRFQTSPSENVVLINIVDGAYYTDAKMEELIHYQRDRIPLSRAIHIEELPETLTEIQHAQEQARKR